MKLIGLILFVVAAFSSTGHAQSINSERRLLLGVKASAEQYSASFKPSVPTQRYHIAAGYSYGVWCAYKLSNYLVVQAGYNQRVRNWGIDYRYVAVNPFDPSIPQKTEATLHYNELQALAEVPLFTTKRIGLSAAAGYGVSYLSSYREVKYYGGQQNFRNSNELVPFAQNKVGYIPVSFNAYVNLTKHLLCRVEPYAYMFTSTLDAKIFKSAPLQYGVSVGICYAIQLRKVEHDSVPAP